MSGIINVGYIDKKMQGNCVYSEDGISATITANGGGLGRSGGALYLVDDTHTSNYKSFIENKKEDIDIEKIPFKYASLFSGTGGFETALNGLGGECVFASEIDNHAQKAYGILYGDDVLDGDITQIDAKDVPDHDLLTAGFPCQSFSVAGRRLGFEDTRGTMFFQVARLAKEKKPKILLLENVKGLVSHDKGKTLDTIVKTLNEIGYTVDFNVLNSKYFGVPQNRERIFIIAVRDDLTTPHSWSIGKATNVVAKGKRRIGALAGVKTFNFDWPAQEEVTTRLRDVLEDSVDERFYLSEEKTARLIEQLNGRHERETDKFLIDDQGRTKKELKPLEVSPTLRREMHGNEPRVVEPQMLGHVDIKGHDAIKRVYDPVGDTPTLTTMGGGHREPKIAEEVRPTITPDRVEKRQNGRRFKEDGEESFTLTAQDRHGVAIGEYPRYRIRKLTPKETFRLQGFTDEQHDALESAGISNSQRYKLAGNAVSVPVISAIGRRLIPYLIDGGDAQ